MRGSTPFVVNCIWICADRSPAVIEARVIRRLDTPLPPFPRSSALSRSLASTFTRLRRCVVPVSCPIVCSWSSAYSGEAVHPDLSPQTMLRYLSQYRAHLATTLTSARPPLGPPQHRVHPRLAPGILSPPSSIA